ncbi:MAG: DsbC family protein [Pseudomonadota bacterium]
MKRYLSSAMIFLACASTAVAADETAKIKTELSRIIPGMEPDSIKPSALPGIYEIVDGTNVMYMSGDGRYFIRGDIFDLQSEKNLTEEVRVDGRKKLLDALKPADMVVFSPEKGKKKYSVTVFTDIDCVYCRRLHSEINTYTANGIEVRYAAFPRAGEGSESFNKAVAVWCSKNKQEAMTKAKAGQQVTAATCNNPVQKQLEAGRELGISGTPSIVLADGRIIPGYVDAQRLLEALAEGK